MGKKIALYSGAILAAILSIATVALAQSSSNFDLSWRALSAGGGRRLSVNYIMEDSVGQMAAGTLKSANNEIVAGFVQSFATSDGGGDDEDHTASFIPFVVK